MAPPVANFPLSELQEKIQLKTDGRKRKKPLNLLECEPLEMVQYSCWLDGEEKDPKAKIYCDPLVRLFRRCANNVMVETTAWENRNI